MWCVVPARFPAGVNEARLFHRTPAENLPSICRTGLDVMRTKRQLYGKGTYFTENCRTALRYCHISPGDSLSGSGSTGQMAAVLLARVCLGQQQEGHEQLEVLDKGFDSAYGPSPFGERVVQRPSGDVRGAYCHVVFRTYQAYPEYVITLRL